MVNRDGMASLSYPHCLIVLSMNDSVFFITERDVIMCDYEFNLTGCKSVTEKHKGVPEASPGEPALMCHCVQLY